MASGRTWQRSSTGTSRSVCVCVLGGGRRGMGAVESRGLLRQHIAQMDNTCMGCSKLVAVVDDRHWCCIWSASVSQQLCLKSAGTPLLRAVPSGGWAAAAGDSNAARLAPVFGPDCQPLLGQLSCDVMCCACDVCCHYVVSCHAVGRGAHQLQL